MSRLLNKAIGPRNPREEHDWAMGIVVSKLGGSRGPQSIYLDGYGALFMLNVKFPLVAPPEQKAQDAKEPEVEDSEWDQTREELFGGRNGRRRGAPVPPPTPEPAAEYDPQKVADLKHNLLEALKNASKLRQVKSDEWITVAVTGAGQSPGAHLVHSVYFDPSGKITSTTSGAQVRRVFKNADNPNSNPDEPKAIKKRSADVFTTPAAANGTASTMTIRVKKSEADSFAKGRMTLDEFEKKASVTSY